MFAGSTENTYWLQQIKKIFTWLALSRTGFSMQNTIIQVKKSQH